MGVILYVNRSGSTLLSRLLSDSGADLFVFPELHFTLDLLAAQRRGRAMDARAVAARVLADPRVPALGLETATLEALALRHGGDLHALLAALATASLGRRPGTIVVKLERYGEFVPELDALLDRPVIIHAVRDPRAAVASMLRTPVTGKPGFDMARGSAVWAARHWRRYVTRVAALADARAIVTVRYEAMVAAPDAAVARVLAALGSPAGAGTRRYVVADADAPLHAGVHAPVSAARVAGWRQELSRDQVRAIDAICAPAMALAGYAPDAVPDGTMPGAALRAARLRVRHGLAMLRHAIGTARHYATGPQRRLILDRLRLARAARRPR